jgi:hypothetical protein
MESLVKLSRGHFTVDDITNMETVLLKALHWKLCPPTASGFCGYFYSFLSHSVNESTRQIILQKAHYFCELTVTDYSVSIFSKQSEIGYAAILNSLDHVNPSQFSIEEKINFTREIEDCTGLSKDSGTITKLRTDLWLLYRKSLHYRLHKSQYNPDNCHTHIGNTEMDVDNKEFEEVRQLRNRCRTSAE